MEVDFNTILALAFTAWAGVVGYIGVGIRNDFQKIGKRLDDIRTDLRQESERLQRYIVQTETRLAVLEKVNNLT